jgi:hypothetical protein
MIDDDTLVDRAFDEFRVSGLLGEPAGVDAVLTTVRRRRRRRVAAAVFTVLALAAPVGVSAAGVLDRDHSPVVGSSTTPAASQNPSMSSPTPSIAPSGDASAAPDGRIDQAMLRGATINVPAWSADGSHTECPSGPVTFTDGSYTVFPSVRVTQLRVASVDVNHDAAPEAVLLLSCGGYHVTSQVLALDRDAAGRLHTVGQVVAQSGTVRGICDVRAGSNGAVQVKVADLDVPGRCGESPAITQWRGYSWNGKTFVQSSGPSTFPANPHIAEVSVTTGDLAFAAPVDGIYHGTLQVHVRNTGPAAGYYQIGVSAPAGLEITPPDQCSVAVDNAATLYVFCSPLTIAGRGSSTFAFDFTATTPVATDGSYAAEVFGLTDTAITDSTANNGAPFTAKF